MIKPELYQHIQKAASLLAIELESVRKRQKKLEIALDKVFPINRYKKLRPDVTDALGENRTSIIEHFVEHGINETNLRDEISEEHNYIAVKLSEALLKDLDMINDHIQIEETDNMRQLIKTEGCAAKLASNQGHNFALDHTSVHLKSNTVCTWIPKNGCSSIRYTIANANGAISSIKDIEWIHDNNDCFNANTKEILQADYTFVILRNPFKRLLSFFLDKLCHTDQNMSDKSNLHAQSVFKFNSSLSYKDFINFIWENPESIYNDEHTRPQNDFMIYRNYDNYFALEKFHEVEKVIKEKIGLELIDVRNSNSIFTTKECESCQEITYTTMASEIQTFLAQKKVPIPENMYSNEMLKKVATLYLQDIILYRNKIKAGDVELQYWIQRSI